MSSAVILFFIGLPGSGKGTVGQSLASHGWVHYSTGDQLRSALKNKDPLAMRYKDKILKGQYLPDDVINNLVWQDIASALQSKKQAIFDGYPRTTSQASFLYKSLSKNPQWLSRIRFVFFDVSLLTSLERVHRRKVCQVCKFVASADLEKCLQCHETLSVRESDRKDRIVERLKTFVAHAFPAYITLRDQYPECCVSIDAQQDKEAVHKRIRDIIHSVKSQP